jgi:murein DD-endopeptidase MepM/ murein hydrolase activator NlpD
MTQTAAKLALVGLVLLSGCGGRREVKAPAAFEPSYLKPSREALPTANTGSLIPAIDPASSPAPATQPACRYVFPVRPESSARYGSSHHDYPATDIFAPIGTEVVAPTDGQVDFVSQIDSWNGRTDDPATRGGLSVAMIGDDGVRYYGSHLRDVDPGVAAGSRVTAGQVLGHVGDTGNAKGTPSHLHFGISHPTTPEDWAVRRGEVSPYRYLNAWKSGKPLTPKVSNPAPARCEPQTDL